MRVELVRLHRRLGVTTIYVTHDQTEAMTLGQRVVVLNKGRVQQVAAPHRLYMHPVNAFVAGFIGSPPMNFLRGRLTDVGVHIGPIEVTLPPEMMARVTPGAREVLVGVRPEGLVLASSGGDALVGEVEVAEELGAERYLYLRAAGLDVVEQGDRPAELAGSICARLNDPAMVAAGETVALRPRPDTICLFDEATGESRIKRD
jgi:multiple sugar transport system ATP-binding protein